jgi:hypothetical protein
LGCDRREEDIDIDTQLGNAHEQHSSLPSFASIPSPDADSRETALFSVEIRQSVLLCWGCV